MIQWPVGSDVFLRAYVTDSTGAAVEDATVTCEVKAAYGADLPGLASVNLSHVTGHEADAVPYNYEATVAAINVGTRQGRFYQVNTTIVRGGRTAVQVEVVDLGQF